MIFECLEPRERKLQDWKLGRRCMSIGMQDILADAVEDPGVDEDAFARICAEACRILKVDRRNLVSEDLAFAVHKAIDASPHGSAGRRVRERMRS